MKLYRDADATLDHLHGKVVAILGYGNQGRSWALNLRDSGLDVVVGNREDSYLVRARDDGFRALSIEGATREADVLAILTTDESQPTVWEESIVSLLRPGHTLVWASGYNVGYGIIEPPDGVDVVMVAPRTAGSEVRVLFERGVGHLAAAGVHRDCSGKAWRTALCVALGIGATRGGVYESSFREEAELDLFAEQIVWPGINAWIEQCFKLATDAGLPPELVVLELYASGEAADIFRLIADEGFYRQLHHHSTTARYGQLSRTPVFHSEELAARAQELWSRDIRGGGFAKEWSEERQRGEAHLDKLWQETAHKPLADVERTLLPLLAEVRQTTRL